MRLREDLLQWRDRSQGSSASYHDIPLPHEMACRPAVKHNTDTEARVDSQIDTWNIISGTQSLIFAGSSISPSAFVAAILRACR